MHSIWHILQTSDSAFPVGGFAHSSGLEGMVHADVIQSVDDLSRFFSETWLPLLAHVDFPLIRLSCACAENSEKIFALDGLAHACRATHESRRAQQQMGSQRLKLVAQLTGHPRLNALREELEQNRWMANWPTVWGVEAACLDIPIAQSLLAYGYQSVNGILAASAKLIRIGPSDIQRILYGCKKEIEAAITQSGEIGEEDIGWFTPLLDITGACHETAYSRLFIS